MHTFRLLTALSAVLLLAACGPLLIRDTAHNGYVPIRLGSFELRKAVTIPAEHARAYLQDGKPVAGVNEFRPHCQLQVNTVKPTAQTVQPDEFNITRATTRTDQVVQRAPLQLTAGDGLRLAHIIPGFDETPVMEAFVFFLHSARQPNVRALICGGAFEPPLWVQRPTLQEIAEALGDYGRLQLQ